MAVNVEICINADQACLLESTYAAYQGGANGIVLGILDHKNEIDVKVLNKLIKTCRDNGQMISFHRAFDAASEPLIALEMLIDCGVDRVLTSGSTWWGASKAIDGLERLNHLITAANNQIEIVIAGGINPHNVGPILKKLPIKHHKVSVHAYTGVLEDGTVTAEKVAALCRVTVF